MKKIFLLSTTLLFLSPLCAQDSTKVSSKPSKNWKEKIVLGGNGGLNIGRNTQININPTIGYRITPKYIAGIGPSFTYISNPIDDFYIYGGSIFNRLFVLENGFLQAEFEQLYYRVSAANTDSGSEIRDSFPALLVGGGLSQPLAGRSRAVVMIQYDVLMNERSLYNDGPIIRGGVIFGL